MLHCFDLCTGLRVLHRKNMTEKPFSCDPDTAVLRRDDICTSRDEGRELIAVGLDPKQLDKYGSG